MPSRTAISFVAATAAENWAASCCALRPAAVACSCFHRSAEISATLVLISSFRASQAPLLSLALYPANPYASFAVLPLASRRANVSRREFLSVGMARLFIRKHGNNKQ
jgi:hypothetical protein